MSTQSKRVRTAIDNGTVPLSEQSQRALSDIQQRYPDVDTLKVSALVNILTAHDFGRNPGTAMALRCVADLIDSTIETAESIEARLDGKLQ